MSHENGAHPATEACLGPGRATLEAAARALAELQAGWDVDRVADWVDTVLARQARVILCGMGKSGLIAQKIAATLASTGCPSAFLHPAEALHGDLGMVTPQDSLVILSNSGESEEVVRLLPSLQALGVPVAAITGRPQSSLARAARWVFSYHLPDGEGCPLNLAPMASTTLQLVWGDLLASALMARRGFTRDGFAFNHPAGSLGSRLMKVAELMHPAVPQVAPEASLLDALRAMTQGRLGMTTVQAGGRLLGVISDGDIRRVLERLESEGHAFTAVRAEHVMSRTPRTTTPDTLAVEAVADMEARKITFLVVTDGEQAVGVLHLHDFLGIGVRELRESLTQRAE